MALYLEARQQETWKFSRDLSPEQNIRVALTKMACFRQAAIDEVTLELYSSALKDLDLRAFQVAMAVLAERPRREGETAFPDLGTVLDLMDKARERYVTPRKPKLNTLPLYEVGTKLLEGERERR